MNKRVIVASHRRSGTHFTIDSILNNFAAFRDNPAIAEVTLDGLSAHAPEPKLSPEQLEARLGSRPAVLKTHAHARLDAFFAAGSAGAAYAQQFFADAKIIYVHRDGRDVLVSQYYYHQKFEPRLEDTPFSAYLREPNNFDASSYEGTLNRVQYWNFHVETWRQHGNCLNISFDDLRSRFAETLARIAEFIDEPLATEIKQVQIGGGKVEGALRRLKNKLSRAELKLSTVSFRGGRSGDWREHFDGEDAAFFAEHAGDMLHELGYE